MKCFCFLKRLFIFLIHYKNKGWIRKPALLEYVCDLVAEHLLSMIKALDWILNIRVG